MMKDYEDATYEIERGPKGLYTVIEWTDGKSLLLDEEVIKEYMAALAALHAEQSNFTDEDMEMLFGIGSEYHGIGSVVE